MDDRANTIAGWALAGGILALGLSIGSGMIFHTEKPEKPGYPVEGAQESGPKAAELPIAALLATADAAEGAKVFKQCAGCHTIAQGGTNGTGPNLWGTMGEEIGHGKGGYSFSEALSGHGGKWDWDTMNAWLTNPSRFASGTKMSFAGLANPQQRANLILFLNQQSANPLPLPPVPVAAPADNAAEGGNEAAPAGDLVNQSSPAPGAPSVDPNAAVQAQRKGH